MTKKRKKLQTKRLQTKATINKDLARALSLTIGSEMRTYTISAIYFNAKERELVATNGRNLLVIKVKPEGLLSITLDLEEGLYNIIGNILIKNDMKQDKVNFPIYRKAIPIKPKEICNGNILHGLLDCIVKNQIHLDIWKLIPILKTLNKLSSFWSFANNSSVEPIVIKYKNDDYVVEYIIMPWPKYFTNMIE